QAELARDVFIAVSLQGNVLSLRFDPSVSRASQNFVRALISATQFVLPSLPASAVRQWDIEEEATAGRYVAHYEEEVPAANDKNAPNEHADVKTFRKAVVRYVQESASKKGTGLDIPVKIQTNGGVTGVFDLGTGHLVSLDGAESRTTVISG